MRFPRQAKIFKGQLDVAPVAAVFFLMIMMFFLAQSSTIIPGVRIKLDSPREVAIDPNRTLFLRKDKKVIFKDVENNVHDLEVHFREENAAGRLPRAFFFDHELGADPALIDRIRRVALETGVRLKAPGSRLHLPDYAGFPGTTNASVILAVNLNGQLFLEHQLVREEGLEEKLRALAAKSTRPLALTLQADKDVRVGNLVRLIGLAQKAGMDEVIIASRAPVEPQ